MGFKPMTSKVSTMYQACPLIRLSSFRFTRVIYSHIHPGALPLSYGGTIRLVYLSNSLAIKSSVGVYSDASFF